MYFIAERHFKYIHICKLLCLGKIAANEIRISYSIIMGVEVTLKYIFVENMAAKLGLAYVGMFSFI